MIENREEFFKEIKRVSEALTKNGNFEYDIKKFKDSFFKQSSHSPENLESMNYIEFGFVRKEYLENRRTFGLKIKDKEILLSDIVYFFENSKISELITKEFPELTSEEIDAALRVLTVIMVGLESQETTI